MAEDYTLAHHLEEFGSSKGPITVVLSNELVQLLSDQLYKSPLKAIEELVVNAYDAAADACFLYVPTSTQQAEFPNKTFICIFDNGHGMNMSGLAELWRIGQSGKRNIDIEKQKHRKVIGKFGIGKLATYTIAHRLTYVSRTSEGIFAVSTDYRLFKSSGEAKPVQLPVRYIHDVDALLRDSTIASIIKQANLSKEHFKRPTWTLGERHLNYLVSEYLTYYHSERPHQSKGNMPLNVAATATRTSDQFASSHSFDVPLRLKDIACRERLGGLLKHYYHQAA